MLLVLGEKKQPVKRKLPKNIVYPAKESMSSCYFSKDSKWIYTVSPFVDKESEFVNTAIGRSFLFYAITWYDAETGRRLGGGGANYDRQKVFSEFERIMTELELEKISDPYHLYKLRISNGYSF